MIPSSISSCLAALQSARCPEDIFGADGSGLKDAYREWAKAVHEDAVPPEQKKIAHEAFILLTKWLGLAEDKALRGTYGDNKPTVLAAFKTKTAAYSVHSLVLEGDIADIYDGADVGGKKLIVKVCRSPKNNDLMKNEANILAALPAGLSKPEHSSYFPNLIDSFEAQNGPAKVRVNVFDGMDDHISVQDILKAYPRGINIKDAAWIFNRMLEAAHLAHTQEIIHASITPDRFFVSPSRHTGVLTDFCYSVKCDGVARAYSPAFKDLYPPELFSKKPLDFGADLYMIARIMNLLIGGDGVNVPAGTPAAVAGLLRACWLGRAHRNKSAKQVHASFKEIRTALKWKKEFRPFPWPVKAS